MLTLRFQRVGKKHDAIFRVVAVDSRFSSKSGKAKEVLGWWNPKKDKFELQTERINYWLKQGAQISDSCFNLLVRAKIINAQKRPVVIHKKKSKEEKETLTQAETSKTEEKPVAEISKESNSSESTSEVPEEKPSLASTSASTFVKASVDKKASADKKATEGKEEIKEDVDSQ